MTPIKKVVIEVIPHLAQRYETCGDWFRTVDDGKATLHVYVSKLGKDIDPYNFMAMCVAYHELGEALACIANDITEETVDEWDNNYKGDGEPGEDPKCPYVHQHNWATTIEKGLLVAMGLVWPTYEKAIERLWKHNNGEEV
jgi:hypothetical protein